MRVCVCVVGEGVDKFIQNQADRGAGGGGGEEGVKLANVAPIVDKLFKNQADFNRKHRLHP